MSRALPHAIVKQLSVSNKNLRQPGIWQGFDERAWERTLTWLDLSGLALYLRQRLEMTDCLGLLPHRVQDRLDRCAGDNRLRAAEMTEELKVLKEMFTGAGVEYLVLKGISLFPDYCPDPAIRTQYDHDLLIRSESVERVRAMLDAAGYRRKNSEGEHPIVYCRPAPNVRFSADFVGFYSPVLGRSIELHHRLWESAEERIEINLPEDWFERASRRRWQDFEYMSLCDEDVLVFQILHAFRHVLRNWCRLSVFLEIAHFLDRRFSDSSFWKRFADRIDNLWWVPEATVVVFSLAETLFGASIPPGIKARLTSAHVPALALWTERYGRSSALANFRNDKYSLFLHREFVKDPDAWAGIRRQRLFPMHRPHRPPAAVFQRGFSHVERFWMEGSHALRRLKFHGVAALRYAWEYPQWEVIRGRLRKSKSH